MPIYLPLTEYSSKHQVSVSTLRRRIKAEDIQYMFEDGRYLILDEPMSTHQRLHRPSPSQTSDDSLVGASSLPSEPIAEPINVGSQVVKPSLEYSRPQINTPPFQNQIEEPILAAANRLLTELKRAYTLILQEKEEQILNLKDEAADLKTLVRVLESENERLKKGSY